MKATREDMVQAALTVERWCDENQDEFGNCKCPFVMDCGSGIFLCRLYHPSDWCLETFLRTRGLDNGKV